MTPEQEEYVRNLRGRKFNGRTVATAGDTSGIYLAALVNDDGWYLLAACDGVNGGQADGFLVAPDGNVALAFEKLAAKIGRPELSKAVIWLT